MKQQKNKYNYDSLRQLSTKLSLTFETQDWGIINADSQRVKEFIIYFNKNSDLINSLRYELFELIIASFNDAIIEGTNCEELNAQFGVFVSENKGISVFEPICNYWQKITSEEFPVGEWFLRNN